MSIKHDATRVAVLTALRDAVDEEVRRLRGDTLTGLVAAREEFGVKSIDVTLPDGTKVAALTLTQPSGRIVVESEKALTEHVAANHPGEVYTETKIRAAFRKRLLERLVDGGDNDVVDPDSGEVVPGVTWLPAGAPRQFSMRFTRTGRQDVIDAWQAGALAELDPPNPPALNGADRG